MNSEVKICHGKNVCPNTIMESIAEADISEKWFGREVRNKELNINHGYTHT